MQRIQSISKNKKASKIESLLICNNYMVRLVDSRWNQVYASLMLMFEKLSLLEVMPYQPAASIRIKQ
jgi:hypothetical protein